MEAILAFDMQLINFISQSLRAPVLNTLMVIITSLGNAGFIWIVISFVFIFKKDNRRLGLTILISMALCYMITDIIIKPLVARPRPFEQLQQLEALVKATSYSFPSGHTASSFAASAAIVRHKGKRGLPFLLLAALIAFSRIYVGVHFFTDVIAGMLLGIATAFIWPVFADRIYDRIQWLN